MGTSGGTVSWGISLYSGSIFTPLGDFMPAGFDAEIQRAFDTWSEVANIDFVRRPDSVSNEAISIIGYNIDGPGGTLAQAGVLSGIALDVSETWAINGDGVTAIDIYSMALHEIGHSIGLGHELNDCLINIMCPAVGFKGPVDGLGEDDIAGVQYIYGARVSEVPLPGAAYLFGASLLGFAGFKSRQ